MQIVIYFVILVLTLSELWLSDNHYTFTKNGNEYTVKRNYESGKVKDTSMTIITSGNGGMGSLHLPQSVLTTDDDGMLRVGFSKKTETE